MLLDYNTIVNKLAAEMDNKVQRSELIASNVANVDTPGYKSRDLKFDRVLKASMENLHLGMKTSHPKHIRDFDQLITDNEIVENPNPGRPDGNNVSIDDELLKLSRNNIQYNIAVQLLSKRFAHLKEAIQSAK